MGMARKVVLFGYEIGKATPPKGRKTASGKGGKAAPRRGGKTGSGDGSGETAKRSAKTTKAPAKTTKTSDKATKESGRATKRSGKNSKEPDKAANRPGKAPTTGPGKAAGRSGKASSQRGKTGNQRGKATNRPGKTATQRSKAAPRQGPAKGGPPGDRQGRSRWHLPWFAAGQQTKSASSKPSRPSGTSGTPKSSKPSGPSKSSGPDGASEPDGSRESSGSSRPPTAVRVLIMVVAFAAMVAFAVVLARLTLQPSAASVPLTHNNLRPGDSLRAYLGQPAFQDTVKQIGGNIVLGVPFGLLLPVLLPRARGLLRVGIATALVMVLVELVQGALVTGRAFDIDDVILNTSGALIGYLLLGRRMGRALHPRRVHWWHRFTKRQTAG